MLDPSRCAAVYPPSLACRSIVVLVGVKRQAVPSGSRVVAGKHAQEDDGYSVSGTDQTSNGFKRILEQYGDPEDSVSKVQLGSVQ